MPRFRLKKKDKDGKYKFVEAIRLREDIIARKGFVKRVALIGDWFISTDRGLIHSFLEDSIFRSHFEPCSVEASEMMADKSYEVKLKAVGA